MEEVPAQPFDGLHVAIGALIGIASDRDGWRRGARARGRSIITSPAPLQLLRR